jgi:hypothetical protein
MPRAFRPAAASSPSRPPPITTARRPSLAAKHGVDIIEIAIGDDTRQIGSRARG